MDDSIQIIDNNIDDEVVIIDNPRLKPPAPVVVLCDSDNDDDEENSGNNKIITEENKQKNSPNNTQKKLVETCKATSSNVINLDDSDSSCIIVDDSPMNDKNTQMKEWYEKYKSSVSPQSSRYYTCPECLAALSSVYMIDRHIQARHPKSIHRFKKNSHHCIFDVLSDSESHSTQPCNETSNSNSNSCGKDSVTPNNSRSCILPRLKLTPLEGKRNLNYNNPSERTASSNTQVSDLNEHPPLPPLCSKSLQHDLTMTSYTNTKNSNSTSTLPSSVTSSTTNSKKTELPLARIKPLMSTSTKNATLESSTTRKPLTVVICSPNDSTTQERMVKVNSIHDKNVHECIVEVDSTDDNVITLEETSQEKTVDNIESHERVVEFILNKNNPKAQDRSKISNTNANSNLLHGNNIVVKRNRKNTRAQMTFAKNLKNDNHSKITKIVDTSNDNSTSKEKKRSKKPLPFLFGTNNMTRKRKRDPLLILTDDDSSEQNIPEKRLRAIPGNDLKAQANNRVLPKKFTCNYCNKRFTTLLGKENHIRDKHTKQKNNTNIRRQPALPFPTNPPEIDKLTSMRHIILIDVDNWRKIFESDLKFAPSTFVWAFHGGATSWCPSPSSVPLRHLQEMNCFYLHPKCGNSKDAADFALCVQAGKLDVQLPKEIPFTVLSGDKGFIELQNQLNLSKREVHIVNPHHKTLDKVLTILNSIADK